MSTKSLFQKKYIPNYLTILRMALVPIIVVFLLVSFGGIAYVLQNPLDKGSNYSIVTVNFLLAGILFVLASLTDFVDGFLARKYKWVSDFGKLWDPIADKVLINSVMICFGFMGLIPIWIPIIMIARDVIVDASRMLAASKNVVVPANFYGKVKTVTQMFAIIFIFFFFCGHAGGSSSNNIYYWAIQNLMMYVALFFSVLSGIIYMVQMQKIFKAKKNDSSKN